MEGLFFLFFIAVIGIFVAVIALERQARLKRIEDLRAVAARLGYEYAEEAGMLGPLEWLGLLSRGHSHATTNLLRAEADGTTTSIFDWRFTVGHGKNRHSYRQTVLLFESPRLDLPAFTLRPEGLGSRLLGLLGQQDIDFEGQPGFSDAYVLQGAEEARIRALFGPARLNFFAQRPGLRVHGQGRVLLYYREDRQVSPAAIPAFAGEGRAVLDLLAHEAPPPAREPDLLAHEAPPLAEAPDPLAGLDELLAEMGVEPGET
ncbi:MAG: hypothetical protein JXA93_18665 [Anaerolineae bacterium]|nr:hypothetical protein [Anaerolineae bacterium]